MEFQTISNSVKKKTDFPKENRCISLKVDTLCSMEVENKWHRKGSTNNSKGSVRYGGIMVGAFIVCCLCLLVFLTSQEMPTSSSPMKVVTMKMKEEGQERTTNKWMQVRIIVYVFSWNEEHMMPFTLAHYSRLADKIVVLDNHSTDQTRSIVLSFAARCQEVLAAQAASPAAAKRGRRKGMRVPIVELRNLSTKAEGEHPLYVHSYWRTTGWKEAKGQYDWAIVIDTDELLYWEDAQKKEYEEEEPRHCANADSKRGGEEESSSSQYSIARRFLETYSDKLVIAPVGYDMWCPSLDLPMAAKAVMGRLRKVKLDDADDLGLLGLCNQGARGSRLPRTTVSNLSKYCLINVARGNKALDLGPGAHVLRSGFSQALELDSERSTGGAIPLRANATTTTTTNDDDDNNADTTIPLKLLHYGAGVGSWTYRWKRYLAIQPRAQKAPITGTVEKTRPKYSAPDFLQKRRDTIEEKAQEVLAPPRYTCQTGSSSEEQS